MAFDLRNPQLSGRQLAVLFAVLTVGLFGANRVRLMRQLPDREGWAEIAQRMEGWGAQDGDRLLIQPYWAAGRALGSGGFDALQLARSYRDWTAQTEESGQQGRTWVISLPGYRGDGWLPYHWNAVRRRARVQGMQVRLLERPAPRNQTSGIEIAPTERRERVDGRVVDPRSGDPLPLQRLQQDGRPEGPYPELSLDHRTSIPVQGTDQDGDPVD